jgi:ketosteroid isomerase-like protein
METMNRQEFARWWAQSWSNRDVDAVAACFADNVRFVSPRAAEVTGNPVVVGRQALRDYWQRAVASTKSIVFNLEQVLEDVGGEQIVIVYRSDIDGQRKRACEFMQFDDEGKILAAEAMHGCRLP